MSTPMTPNQLLKALKDEGLTVIQVAGWRDRCRCHTGSHEKGGPTVRPWGPVNGTMVHITAGDLNGRTVLQYIAGIINGDPKLPSKAQIIIAPDGVVYLNSAGRCNHAGEISQKSLDKAIAASFSTTGYDDERGHGVDGNQHFYGIENIAAKSMTAPQHTSSVKTCAAIARFHKWDGKESAGHGECSDQRGYADPNLDMGKFRLLVAAQVIHGATPAPVPTPVPPKPTKTTRVTSVPQNVAGYNAPSAPGVKKFKTHIPNIAKATVAAKADIADFQELSTEGPDMRPLMDLSLKGKMTRAPGGSDGRFNYYAPTVKRIASGVFQAPKKTLLDGDTKQASWVAFEKDGIRGMDISVHTENQDGVDPKNGDADELRVRQVFSFLDQGLAKCKTLWILPENLLIVGDMNSKSYVRQRMLSDRGWHSVAEGTADERNPTFNQWGKAALVYDFGFIKNPKVSKPTYKVQPSTDSDHNRLIISRELITK